MTKLDERPFTDKKRIQSAIRAVLPQGMLTGIVVTANHRAWRHMIEMRTASEAEEEIREAFLKAFHLLRRVAPGLYQDAEEKDDGTIVFANSKV